MPAAVSIPLSDAKAHLSSIVHTVRDTGGCYTITLHNKPVAMVVPIPLEPPKTSATRGMLSSYANADMRALESAAFQDAIEAKHANAS